MFINTSGGTSSAIPPSRREPPSWSFRNLVRGIFQPNASEEQDLEQGIEEEVMIPRSHYHPADPINECSTSDHLMVDDDEVEFYIKKAQFGNLAIFLPLIFT